ncbi:SDR family NAD(P)-dependent oxidoreductase [Frigidibacter albus]|uniref:SDR family NAD(P)-dependent oxidoreductase n=1 Tax=Frigidibacter albus TaxID=1465486 RepID=A0A6L8VI38_9RHOB|nr:SDR family NAD(P)-dependent oxidoreductase [Frigidibacter albus]MZQ90098.1 SDR family NAD(P)-dependent oxidoreductase [Frigidibacter albus]NBE32006.1 SDR family NAD(P)-dependent oxidoreductase [Frigidibacter albus]GGH57403.1 oxidoreductase [Frigidibacter albus]
MTGLRVSVVTGASSGIGRGLALALARRGDLVLAVGRDPARLETLAEALAEAGPGAHRTLSLDVANEADMARLRAEVEALGRADLMVASAAVGRAAGAGLPPATRDLPLADWQRMVDVNLHGVFLANAAVLPLMRAQGDGDIVNIGSSTTPHGLRGTPLAPAYSATKFALAEYGRALAEELAPEGVRVRTIFPGPVETPLIAGTLLDGPFGGRISEANFAAALLGLIELGRGMVVADPHLLPVPQRGRVRRKA